MCILGVAILTGNLVTQSDRNNFVANSEIYFDFFFILHVTCDSKIVDGNYYNYQLSNFFQVNYFYHF